MWLLKLFSLTPNPSQLLLRGEGGGGGGRGKRGSVVGYVSLSLERNEFIENNAGIITVVKCHPVFHCKGQLQL